MPKKELKDIMATGNLKYFKGRIANVIGYQSDGRQFLRSMPRGIQQTAATKQSGLLFGKASRLAAEIRHQLPDIIPNPSDLKMQTRLTGSVYKWLKENSGKSRAAANHLPFIEGYQFNDDGYTLSDRMRIPIEIILSTPGILQIKIPAFTPVQSIVAPAGTASVLFHFAAVNCSLDHSESSFSTSAEQSFDFNDNEMQEQDIFLEIPTHPESLLITVLSLRYLIPSYNGSQISSAKGFKPTAILNAMSL